MAKLNMQGLSRTIGGSQDFPAPYFFWLRVWIILLF